MNKLNIPTHVAFILDGNGRWAKKRNLPRTAGHVKGAKVVEQIVEDAGKLGIKYVTMYAFSTENWNRPQDEVNTLMNLLRDYLKTCKKTAAKNNLAVRIIGDKTRLDADIQDKIAELEEFSSHNDGLHLQIAINYGGRDEIRRAVTAIVDKVNNNEISKENISEELISDFLDTHNIPDPDLLIRTSGEERLSNYLIWQLAYTEFYFTDVLWPDFNKNELIKAIESYSLRKRKFGKTEEQLEDN